MIKSEYEGRKTVCLQHKIENIQYWAEVKEDKHQNVLLKRHRIYVKYQTLKIPFLCSRSHKYVYLCVSMCDHALCVEEKKLVESSRLKGGWK